MQLPTIPFKIEMYDGLAELKGILSYADSVLNLEFQTKDAFLGIIKSEVKEISIPVDDIEDISFKKGLLGGKMKIQLTRMKLAEGFPMKKPGEIVLSIGRNEREVCIEVATHISLEITEMKYRRTMDP